uniref:Methyltransferase, FkbM family n=1 Tax=uncultured Chloroflexota bacterium TaxID=166587 RepID=H5SIB6_9CHLR|nr:methyltransferase, FkbM family [uncultured Chloroflexota bacterium]BAL55902.1 methyltransferase, FkbM family [uncultured Chloroflexota bacterium]
MLWQGRKALNRFPCDISLRKITLRVGNRTVAGIGALVHAMGYYDPNNMYFLEEIFSKGLCTSFYDVGANIGIYSLIVASSSPFAKVAAFEPHPKTFLLLQENISLNGFQNVRPWPVALGDENRTIEFTDDAGSPVNRVVVDEKPSSPVIVVQMRTGDALVQDTGLVPDVLKIDVEGFENQVLWGFKNTLSSIKLLLVECQNLSWTTQILSGEFGFLGPYKINFRARRLAQNASPPWEDWLFVQPSFLKALSQAGFNVA